MIGGVLLALLATASVATGSRIDVVDGTDGDDALRGTPRGDLVRAYAGSDLVRALGGADTVRAGAGADDIEAGGGADRLFAGPGRNTVHGGPGIDTIELVRGGPPERVVCGPDFDEVFGAGPDDRLTGCERIGGR